MLKSFPFKKLCYTLLLLIAAFSLCHGSEEQSDVLVLNRENFERTIRSHPQILIEFYTPHGWIHQDLLTHFTYAAETLGEEKSSVKLGKVDVTVEVELARKFRIRSYPTLKFFVEGEEKPYTGGKSEQEILEWIHQYGEPKAKKIETLTDFENTINENDLVLVYWGTEDHYEYANFVSLALTYPEIVFISVNEPEINVKYPIIENARVTLFKKFDQPRVEFTGHINKNRLSWFIRDNKDPLVLEFAPEHSRKFFYGDLPTVMVVLSDNEESKGALDCLSSVAEHLKGKILITKVSQNNNWKDGILDELQATGKELPLLAIIKPTSEGPLKYVYEDTTINGGVILQFFHKCSDGRKQPQLKSEPVPDNQKNDVKIVTGKTFKDLVLDDAKDVLLLVHATGNKNPSILFAIWEELAVKVKSIGDLVIAKIDTSLNDAIGIKERPFPTILFYPKGNKANIEKYDGSINVESLWKWIEAKKAASEKKVEEEKTVAIEVEPAQPEPPKENKEDLKSEEKVSEVETKPEPPRENKEETPEEKTVSVETKPEPSNENKENAKVEEKPVPVEAEPVQPVPQKENKEDVRGEEKSKEHWKKDQDL